MHSSVKEHPQTKFISSGPFPYFKPFPLALVQQSSKIKMQPELSRSSKRHRSRSSDIACSSRVVGLVDDAAMGCDLKRGAMISTQSHTHPPLVACHACHRLRRSRRSVQIRHLDLLGSYNLTDTGLVSIAILRQLRRLVLDRCINISDAGLVSIAALHQLQTLHLGCCPWFTDAGIARISAL